MMASLRTVSLNTKHRKSPDRPVIVHVCAETKSTSNNEIKKVKNEGIFQSRNWVHHRSHSIN